MEQADRARMEFRPRGHELYCKTPPNERTKGAYNLYSHGTSARACHKQRCFVYAERHALDRAHELGAGVRSRARMRTWMDGCLRTAVPLDLRGASFSTFMWLR